MCIIDANNVSMQGGISVSKFRVRLPNLLVVGCISFTIVFGCSGGDSEDSKLMQIAVLEDQAILGDGELLAFLDDPNPQVRRRAVLAAGRIGDTLAVSALIESLDDPDTTVRAYTAFALGSVRGRQAKDAVYQRLKEETNPTALRFLLWTMGRLYAQDYADSLLPFLDHDNPGVRTEAALVQGAVMNREAGLALGPLLQDPDPLVRSYACHALTRLKPPALADEIAPLQDDPNLNVVASATMALGNTGDSEYHSDIVKMLEHPDRYVRYGAVMGIGALRDTTRLEKVYPYLHTEKNGGILTQLVFAVSYHAQRSSEPEFAKLIDHPDIGVRVRLADAFMRILQKDSFPYLRRLARDPAWPVRAAVPKQLEFFVQPEWGRVEEATALIKELLQDSIPAVRGSAVRSALAFRGAIREPVQATLEDPDPLVRYYAFNVLPFASGRLTFDSLLALYKHHQDDERPDMRMAILALTANLSPSVQVGPVQRQIFNAGINDPDRHVRYYAAAVWEKFRENHWDSVGAFATDITPEIYQQLYHADSTRPRVRVVTEKGTFTIELHHDEAPRAVRHFLDHVDSKFYDDTPVNPFDDARTIFIGDRRGDGWGTDPETMSDETTLRRIEKGTVYWRINLGHDSRSEFGISLLPQPFSNFLWTSFGGVVQGMDVAEQLRPLDRIIRIERVAPEVALH